MKIKYIDYGIGNRVGDTIYLNKNLKKYPKLHKAILIHEKNHSGKFKLKDLWLDWNNKELRGVKIDYYKFIFKYPKSLLNFFPIIKLGGEWSIDISLLLMWIITKITIILLIIWHLK